MCLTRGRTNLIDHKKVTFWRGDITNVEFPDETYKFTDLIHGAAEANDLLNPDQPRYYHAVVGGADRIVEWANTRDFNRILFISSGCVSKGNSTYCRAKRLSEWLFERSGTPAKVARLYSVVGEELPIDGQYAIGKFIGSALKGEVKYYRSHSVRSYLHVDDCAKHLLDILDRGDCRTYDVGSKKSITVTDLAHLVANVFEVPIRVVEEKPHQTSVIYLPGIDYWPGEETVTLIESLRRIRAHLLHSNVEPMPTARKVH
jgi:nucleoside-diphosphate-sugar epimerase